MSAIRRSPASPIRRSVPIFLGAFLAATDHRLSVADSLRLVGGERLVGRILKEDATAVTINSLSLGQLSVPRGRIEEIVLDPLPSDKGPSPPTAESGVSPSRGAAFLPWQLDEATADSFDWIQLNSGEWLKGDIKSLQKDKLEFDSDKLNALTFDWKDIRMARAPGLHSLRFERGVGMDGSILVTTNQVEVITGSATNLIPRSDLLAITPTGDRELDKWTGKLATGLGFRSGNSRELDVDVHFAASRRTPSTRLNLDYLGNYTKINGGETANNQRFNGTFDSFLSRRLYVRVPDFEYYRDPLQNLAHRATVGGGIGYDLISNHRTEWNVTTGPAWQGNWFENVPAGEAPSANSVALVLSSRFDIQLTPQIEYIFEYRGQVTSAENGNNTHHAVSTLEFEIRKQLKLDLSLIWDRITTPRVESSGKAPTSDDFRLTTSLAVEY